MLYDPLKKNSEEKKQIKVNVFKRLKYIKESMFLQKERK
jgi:hypothetical protein